MKKRHTIKNFAVGRTNQLAYLSIRRVLKDLGGEINPLFIFAKKGLGKTHLMYAVREELTEEQVEYFDCTDAKFIPEMDGTVLILENFHLLPDELKKGGDIAHTITSFIEQKKQVFITSLYPPEELNLSDKLITIIKEGLTVPILRPDPELVARIFKMMCSNCDFTLNNDVINFLSGFPFGDIREISSVLKRIDLLREVTEEITVENVKDSIALEEIVAEERVSAEAIPENSEFFDFVKELRKGSDNNAADEKDSRALREEYMQKLYIWKMKGFHVKRLEEVIDKPIEKIIQVFVSFTSDVQRLIELQKIYGGLEKSVSRKEREFLEKQLFDPDAIFEIARNLKRIEDRKSQKADFNRFLDKRLASKSFVILPSNREAFGVLKNVMLNKDTTAFPVHLHGGEGCGKTHLIVAFAKKMQVTHPDMLIAYIPSAFLAVELKNRHDEESRNAYLENLKGIDTLFLDDIDTFISDTAVREFFGTILDTFCTKEKQLIITSRIAPQKLIISVKHKHLISAGTTVPIKAITQKDRLVIVNNFFVNKTISVSDELKEFLSRYLYGNFTDIKNHLEDIVKNVVNENLEFSIDTISKFVDVTHQAEEPEEEKVEKAEETSEKPEDESSSQGAEKILLTELDQKWPFLKERIFEDHAF